jgi:hypothetical protein
MCQEENVVWFEEEVLHSPGENIGSGQPASAVRYEANTSCTQSSVHCIVVFLVLCSHEAATITNICKEHVTTFSRGDNTAQASFFQTSNVYHFGML